MAPSNTPPFKIIALLLLFPSLSLANSDHQLFNWTLQLWQEEIILHYNVTSGAPSFTIHACCLTNMGLAQAPGCGKNGQMIPSLDGPGSKTCYLLQTAQGREPTLLAASNQVDGYYICPDSTGSCHDPSHYYCPSWGCESIAYGWSNPPNNDKHIKATGWPYITITVQNPADVQWLSGHTWGIRLYMVHYDYGSFFKIQKTQTSTSPSAPVGPNLVLNPQPPPPPPPSPSTPISTQPSNPPQRLSIT